MQNPVKSLSYIICQNLSTFEGINKKESQHSARKAKSTSDFLEDFVTD